MERMIGCLVLWKCFVACLFFEESQQPTCPHSMHSRRCTQVSPILTQSWQTCTSVLLNLICFQCAQPVVMMPSLTRLPRPLRVTSPALPGPTSPRSHRLHTCSGETRAMSWRESSRGGRLHT